MTAYSKKSAGLYLIFFAYLYVAMEWLFFATKPSFMAQLNYGDRLSVFLASGFIFLSAASLIFGLCLALQFLASKVGLTKLRAPLLVFAPALVATVLAVILVDNFSYTVFSTGIIRTAGIVRGVYLGTVLVIFFVIAYRTKKKLANEGRWKKPAQFLLLALPIMSLSLISVKLIYSAFADLNYLTTAFSKRERMPNILFFAADGTDASRLPMYGSDRDTVPNLSRLIKERPTLIVENAFSNAARTTGSLTSMLTGKLPISTKVFFPPHILLGKDSYQHFPGILKKLGYTTFQETVRYYADAYDLNLLRGFDVANERTSKEETLPEWLETPLATDLYFYLSLWGRLKDRALHLLGIQPMINYYAKVTAPQKPGAVYGIEDSSRIERSIAFMKAAEKPFFMHIHLMDAHCCGLRPEFHHFSNAHEKPRRRTSRAFIDDLIYSSDVYFGKLIDELKASGKLKNTVIVYSSDHNRGWSITERVPLIFIFPGGEKSGQFKKSAQLLDVAPTVLAYLKLPIPSWMEGVSLLEEDKVDPDRLVYGIMDLARKRRRFGGQRVTTMIGGGPPRYGLRTYTATYCNHWYELDVNSGEVGEGDLEKGSLDCTPPSMTKESAKDGLVKHLLKGGIYPKFLAAPKA